MRSVVLVLYGAGTEKLSNLALDEKGGNTRLNQSSINRQWMVIFRESTETKAEEGKKQTENTGKGSV